MRKQDKHTGKAGTQMSERLFSASALTQPRGTVVVTLLRHQVDRPLLRHSDHTVGIPDLWLTGWLPPHFGKRTTSFRVIGPTGANTLMEHLEKAYALDIAIRTEDERLPVEGIAIEVEEFAGDGIVYERNGLRVIAFEVDHGEAIKPAYGYRVEFGGRVAVISGDTRTAAQMLCHTEIAYLGADKNQEGTLDVAENDCFEGTAARLIEACMAYFGRQPYTY